MRTIQHADIIFSVYFDNATTCLHRNHSHVLVYVHSGEFEIVENGKVACLHSGDCAFVRKDYCVQLTKRPLGGEQFKATFLLFTTKFLREYYQTIDKRQLPTDAKRSAACMLTMPSEREDIQQLFGSLEPYYNSDLKPTDEFLRQKMLEGVGALLRTDVNVYASLFDFASPWKIDIMDFMERHFSHDLTMQDIANYTGRSLSTFKRDWKKCCSITPEKWLIRRRLEAANELISQHSRSVTDICFEVGFKNLSHFSRSYKEVYGYSPTEQA